MYPLHPRCCGSLNGGAAAPGDGDQRGDEPSHPHGLCVGFGQVSVQFVQVEQRENDAHEVDGDPEHVEHVMAEGPVHQRTGGRVVAHLSARRQRTAQERRPQVDGDGREPDHERAKQYTLRWVQQQRTLRAAVVVILTQTR